MSEFELIKDLREKTGAGFLDCKNALKESDNDIQLAIDTLRKKGLAKATKKTSREAKEGAVGFYTDENVSVILKVNSETDFAAKNDTFLNFVDLIGQSAIENFKKDLNVETFLNLKINDKKIIDIVNEMIAKIGENIIISDLIAIDNNDSYTNYYVHNSYRKNIGKIVSVIKYNSSTKDAIIEKFTKDICMHIAALKPESLDKSSLSQDIVAKELNIQKELIANSNKPSKVLEKILEGKMNKFYSEVTLLNQNFVLDPNKKIREVINEYQKEYEYKISEYYLMSLI